MEKDLEQFIKEFKDKNDLKYDEANTKSFIIEKVLTYLKWDVHSPDDIAREQGRKKKIDYELKAGNIDIGIEAKPIKQNLSEDDGKQLLGYCGDSHILAILTNGKDWWFYLPQAEGGPSRKRFYMMDIFRDPSDAASKLIDLLSKDNIINGNAIENAKSMYREQRHEIKKPIPTKVKLEIPKIEKEQDYLSIDNDFTKKSIESYYFNGSIYNVNSWKGLLVGILDNIYTLHRKDFDKILGVTGGNGRIYFSQGPDEVDSPLKIKDTGIYVTTKLSANNIVRLCSDIIFEFGYSDNDLKIKIISEAKEIVSQPKIMEQTLAKPIIEEIVTTPILEEQITEKGKKERYGEYQSAIRKLLPNINKWIAEAQDGIIKLKTSDIAKDLGKDFVDKSPTSIYWGLRYVLFNEGIYVGTGTTKSGEKLLLLREKTPKDKLPPSLASSLKEEKEEEKGDTIDPNNTGHYLSIDDDVKGMTISSFIFDGSKYDVSSWRELLTEIINIIYSRHKRKFDKILDIKGGQGRRYFSRRRILDDPIEIEGAGIYVEGKLSSNNIVRLCYDIINEFGYSNDDLKIEAD